MRRSGFTFIELIVSTLIFTIILFALYSTFYMGIRTWKKSQERRSIRKIRMSFLRMEKELKDTFLFSGIPFSGTDSWMRFPLSISDVDSEKIFIVSYVIEVDKDTRHATLTRKQKPFSEDPSEGKEKITQLLTSMKTIRFEYAYEPMDPFENLEWQVSWDPIAQKGLPSGIRIFLEQGNDKEVYAKTIFLQNGKLGAR